MGKARGHAASGLELISLQSAPIHTAIGKSDPKDDRRASGQRLSLFTQVRLVTQIRLLAIRLALGICDGAGMTLGHISRTRVLINPINRIKQHVPSSDRMYS